MTQRWIQDFYDTMDRQLAPSGSLDPRLCNNPGMPGPGLGFVSREVRVCSPLYF